VPDVAAEMAVPLPLSRPETEVEIVRAGVAPPDEEPANPFALATDTAVTEPVAAGVHVRVPEPSFVRTPLPFVAGNTSEAPGNVIEGFPERDGAVIVIVCVMSVPLPGRMSALACDLTNVCAWTRGAMQATEASMAATTKNVTLVFFIMIYPKNVLSEFMTVAPTAKCYSIRTVAILINERR